MDIIYMKNIISKIKKIHMEERKSVNMERKNRENLETKQNRTLRKCGTISKDLTYLYLESHRRQDRELSRQCI